MENEKLLFGPNNYENLRNNDKEATSTVDFKLSHLRYSNDLGKVFNQMIKQIEELDDNGTLLISALNEKIKIGKNKFKNLDTNHTYSYFSLNEKKEILIFYESGKLCTYSFTDSTKNEFRDKKYIRDLKQVNNEHVIIAFYTTSYIQVEPWSNFVKRSEFYHCKYLVGHAASVNCLCAVGKTHLLSGSNDNTIKLWDLSKLLCIHTFIGHLGIVDCVELFGNDKFLSGSSDKTIKLWDLEKGECLKTFYGHDCGISMIRVLKTNEILSLSYDGVIKQWDINTDMCMSTLRDVNDSISYFKVLSNENLITGSREGRIKIWSKNEFDFKHKEKYLESKNTCNLS
ncbi:unnamed protein product [Brachionus calyciflorus]|uniref:Uncharacterized protein n=1 Tax=Brachionus calyciflorus TaxID=104777 RepID=A0A813QUP0_9BILA|nr:unnamed protein product [Brachionus calyciflorus]